MKAALAHAGEEVAKRRQISPEREVHVELCVPVIPGEGSDSHRIHSLEKPLAQKPIRPARG